MLNATEDICKTIEKIIMDAAIAANTAKKQAEQGQSVQVIYSSLEAMIVSLSKMSDVCMPDTKEEEDKIINFIIQFNQTRDTAKTDYKSAKEYLKQNDTKGKLLTRLETLEMFYTLNT